MKHGLLAAVACAALLAAVAPSLAEDYPGADRRQADIMRGEAEAAIQSARQRHADTTTADYLYNKAVWEVSQGHHAKAVQDFRAAEDALRPAPPVAEEGASPATASHEMGPVPVARVPAAPAASGASSSSAVRHKVSIVHHYHRVRHRRRRHSSAS